MTTFAAPSKPPPLVEAVLDPAVQARLIRGSPRRLTRPDPLPDGLTEREGEVLRLIAAGMSNCEIAARLFVSDVTVKTHVNHIYAKISCRGRAQAVTYAHQHRLM